MAEKGGLCIQGQPGLYSEFKGCVDYVADPVLNRNSIKTDYPEIHITN